VASAFALAIPAAAPASTVSVPSGSTRQEYRAAPGERNDLSIGVAVNFQNEAFVDDSVPIAPGNGCRRVGDGTQAVCEIGTETLSFVRIDLGDRNDALLYRVSQATTNPFPDLVLDGPGADRVTVDSWRTTAANGPGADVFTCLSACAVLTGRVAGAGTVSGAGDDRLYGSAEADRLMGGTGADRAYGGAGPDRLFGGAGPDRLFGQAGNDWLYGGPGPDLLSGGTGSNRLLP
jgi:Ca2+-binding RTX toxin-like protein